MGQLCSMDENMKNAYIVLVGKSEGKKKIMWETIVWTTERH